MGEARLLNLLSFTSRARPHWEGAVFPQWVMDGVLPIWPIQCDEKEEVTGPLEKIRVLHTAFTLEVLILAENASAVAFLGPSNSKRTYLSLRPQTGIIVTLPQNKSCLDTEQHMLTGSAFCSYPG